MPPPIYMGLSVDLSHVIEQRVDACRRRAAAHTASRLTYESKPGGRQTGFVRRISCQALPSVARGFCSSMFFDPDTRLAASPDCAPLKPSMSYEHKLKLGRLQPCLLEKRTYNLDKRR
jgi:hypothetical protein